MRTTWATPGDGTGTRRGWESQTPTERPAMVTPDRPLRLADADATALVIRPHEACSLPAQRTAASIVITCLNYPRRPVAAQLPTVIAGLDRASPTFGRFLADPVIVCSVWPIEPIGAATPVHASGADPILIIGTTQDPAAPCPWSLALADQLQSARLLTYDGIGHTTIGRPNTCVENAVTAYLLRGELTALGTTCRAPTD